MMSPNCSGRLDSPSLVVVHYTASAGFSGTRDWFLTPKSKVSAHELIGRNGEFAQLVPYDKCAWHAGTSSWKGRFGVNKFSIGIELVSWGPLILLDDGFASAFQGKRVEDGEVVHAPRGAYEFWQGYTELQLLMLEQRIMHLFRQFPSLEEVVGHSDVSPGRKMDPWPLDAKKYTERGLKAR